MEPAKECVTTHLPKSAVPKMDGAQVSEAEFASQSTATVAATSRALACKKDMEDCSACWGYPWLECLLAQILVAVASTPSGEEQNNPAMCG